MLYTGLSFLSDVSNQLFMKTLLVYPPFCTPASPPFSITSIFSFLRNNLTGGDEVDVLDLNILFHKRMFSSFQAYYRGVGVGYDRDDYDEHTEGFRRLTAEAYSSSNRKVVAGDVPELFDELLDAIIENGPDIVALSIVFSSQAFYSLALVKALKAKGVKTVVGGPAVNAKLRSAADHALANEVELLELITGEKVDHDSLDCETVLDFNIYDLGDYFTPAPVIPLKTTSSCYYRRCTFCTHHHGMDYYEIDLGIIKRSIEASRQKRIFFVDDLMHKKRLLQLAEMLKPMGVEWMCQLRPTPDLDADTMKTLRGSGLKVVLWGVESGSDRVLGMMRKGTKTSEVAKVLHDSHDAGIRNVVYIMFGFPSETEDELGQTISFLEDNKEYIDLVSTSVFGLQKGTPIYEHPERFCITGISEKERTVLDSSISYQVSEGISNERASELRKRHMKTLEKINDFPKTMNFFREHMLCLS